MKKMKVKLGSISDVKEFVAHSKATLYPADMQ